MKKLFKTFTTIILILAIVFALAGCEKDKPSSGKVTTYEKPQDNKEPKMNINPMDGVDLKVDSYKAKEEKIEITPAEQAKLELADNITIYDDDSLKNISQEKLDEIIKNRDNLLLDLENEFKAEGIKITVDKSNGDVILDSAILFDTDESVVSDEGKEFLTEFLPIYTSVIFDKKYKGFVSKIMVEGHTDTEGSYEYNEKLSQDRADNVKDFCKSGESGISAEVQNTFNSMVESKGYSFDRPIKDSNGNIDMDASRRVTFRFLINLDF